MHSRCLPFPISHKAQTAIDVNGFPKFFHCPEAARSRRFAIPAPKGRSIFNFVSFSPSDHDFNSRNSQNLSCGRKRGDIASVLFRIPSPNLMWPWQSRDYCREINSGCSMSVPPSCADLCWVEFYLRVYAICLILRGGAKLRVGCGKTARKSTQPSPSLTQKPCRDKRDFSGFSNEHPKWKST